MKVTIKKEINFLISDDLKHLLNEIKYLDEKCISIILQFISMAHVMSLFVSFNLLDESFIKGVKEMHEYIEDIKNEH